MSGIALLRRLLMKQAMKKSASPSGIMSLNKNLVNDVETQVKKWVDSAKKQGADIDKMSEQELKYVIELNKPKGPMIGEHRVIDATSSEGQGITRDLFNMLDRQSGKNVIKTDFGGGVTDIVTETITKIKTMKPIEAMAEANSVIGRKGKYKRLTEKQSQKILKDTNDHIFERDIKPDPEDFAHGGRSGSGLNYLLGEDDQNSRVPYAAGSSQGDFNQFLKDREQRDREEQKRKFKKDYKDWKKWKDTQGGTMDFAAEGGRAGFGLGGMGRRAFLKLMGGAAAGTAAAKTGLLSIFKGGGKKQVIKDLTSVPIKDISGMPAWFKPLVNKVIKEGTDLTKELGTIERQLVHKTKLPNSKTDVYVTQDLNTGDVLVDIGSGKHGFADGHFGQPVRLEYRAGEVIEPTIKKGKEIKGTKTKEEFWVEEAEFSGGHPENVKFEESAFEKYGEHGTDFTEVEKFATGKIKKKTAKESIKAERAHWTPEGDMASGGRVPLGEGGDPGTSSAEEVREAWKDFLKEKEKGTFKGSWKEFQPIWIRANLAQGGRVSLSAGGLAGMLGE